MKKKILFNTEFSILSTGFAVYGNQIMRRLYATGKYEIAEYGAYGRSDSKEASALPWKFYGVLPNNKIEEDAYTSKKTNQFGGYKFDAVVADFQPDIVIDSRDPWMMTFIQESRFRKNFKTLLIPTVDSGPQKNEWVDNMFKKSDYIATYSRFGAKILKEQGVTVSSVASPGVDLELFKPVEDKLAHRKEWGFKKGLMIIGTVMRNQRRKLFPDLFEAYALLRKKYGHIKEIKRSVLLCHTSWPDVGWDLPELLRRSAILRHVIFTYKCDSCTKIFFSWFIDGNPQGMCRCIFCGKMSAHMPSTHNGVDVKSLVEIYNLMDIYVQPAICEGWGLPIVEAKACGIPGLYSDYSAMEDHVENGGGLPIKIHQMYTEAETMAERSLPDKRDFADKLKMLLTNHGKRLKMGIEAREVCEKLHNWDTTAKTIENIIDSIEIYDRNLTWDERPLYQVETNPGIPAGLTNEQFIVWCYKRILGREPDQKGFTDWMNSLAKGSTRAGVEKYFRGQIETDNKFENVRWKKSLKNRGFNIEPTIIVTDRIPGVFI